MCKVTVSKLKVTKIYNPPIEVVLETHHGFRRILFYIMKKCNHCKIEKEFDEFCKNKNEKDGVDKRCKYCSKVFSKKYIEKEKEIPIFKICKICSLSKNNIDFHKKSSSKDGLYDICKVCRKPITKKYHSNPLVRERINNQRKNKYKTDLNYKLSCILRSRFLIAINKNYKKSSIFDILGISIEGFKKHISSLFMGNMSWDNYGLLWELDHINPISSFNLKEKDEQIKCFNYKNYQPLYITTNIALSEGCIDCIGNRNKSSKISW